MKRRLRYIPKIPRPSKTAVKAHLNFLALGNQDDFITQCNDCRHALSDRYVFADMWCDLFTFAPLGICIKKEPVKNENTNRVNGNGS